MLYHILKRLPMNKRLMNLIAMPLLLIALAVPFFLQETMAQEIGIQTGSMRELFRQDVRTALARMQELGIKELEGGAPRGMDKAEYRKLLEEYGLKIVAVGAGFDGLENDIQPIIDNAKAFDAKYVICYWIPHDGDNFTFEDMKKGVEVFNAAGKTLKENGLILSYHAHGYEFQPYNGSTLFEYMMDNTDPEYVTFQMDVFWMKNPGQDPVALLKKYPTRWKSLHLKDRRVGSENNLIGRQDPETNVVLGTGDVGIEEVMKTAVKLGIKHYFIEDESSRALEQVPKSIEFLKSIQYN